MFSEWLKSYFSLNISNKIKYVDSHSWHLCATSILKRNCVIFYTEVIFCWLFFNIPILVVLSVILIQIYMEFIYFWIESIYSKMFSEYVDSHCWHLFVPFFLKKFWFPDRYFWTLFDICTNFTSKKSLAVMSIAVILIFFFWQSYAGYDPYNQYYQQYQYQYYENLRRTNPQAYAEIYRKYYEQHASGRHQQGYGPEDRSSVHSGRSSVNGDVAKDRWETFAIKFSFDCEWFSWIRLFCIR